MPKLTISVLGPPVVTLNGNRVEGFEYHKVRALLIYLAVEAALPHTRGSLAALLWPHLPERTARGNLSQALTKLRLALGEKTAPVPFVLVHTDSLQLNPASDIRVDMSQFLALLDAAETHSHRSWRTCSPCAERLRQAMALYRGDFLADFSLPDSSPFEEWASPRREHLRQRALSALERLVQWAEWRREYGAAADYARRQVEMQPLIEVNQRSLMRLLALAGQRRAALAQYEELRRILEGESRSTPEPETSALSQTIGAGAFETADPTPRPADAGRLAAGRLVGRAHEVGTVVERLHTDGVRALTLAGPPGVGKTRVALEAANVAHFDFEEGASFVELTPINDPALVPSVIAQALNVKEQPGHPLAVTLTRVLQNQHRLLVLDNFEHVLEAAPFVAELLAACPALKILTTSRTPLGIRAEQQYSLSTLALPGPQASFEQIAASPAVQLFVERARAAGAEFALTAENAGAVALICARLDGLPLAIELIAVQLCRLAPAALLRQLEGGLEAFAHGSHDLAERHRTLRRAIAWSYERLNEDAQHVFAHLGVFVGGCTAEAVEAVAGPGRPAWFALEALAGASLISTHMAAGERRFTLLEILREFAREQLEARGALDAAQRRHTDYVCRLAEAAYDQLLGPDQARWSERVAAEFDNVRAAVHWARQAQQVETSLRIATGVFRFCWQRGFMREGLSWMEPAFGQLEGVPPDVQSRAFRAAGVLAWGLSDYARACQWSEAAIAAGRQAGDDYLVAAAVTNMGLVLHDQGEWEMAGARLAEAIRLNRAFVDRPHAVKFPLVVLAGLYVRLGRMDEAGQLYEECLKHNRALGDAEGTANSLYGLALAAGARGDYGLARRLGEEALQLYGTLNHQYGAGWVHYHVGNILRDAQAFGEARQHYEHSLRIWLEREDAARAALVLEAFGQLLGRQGRWRSLAGLLSAAAALREGAHAVLTPYEESGRQALIANCRAAVGDTVFETDWQAGSALSLARAVEQALAEAARPTDP